jgi:hypothetical protein
MTAAEPTLGQMLAERARRVSDARLVVDSAGGIVGALIVGLVRPRGWLLLLSAALCFAAFGAWGITDRELADRQAAGAAPAMSALVAGRWAAALIGGAAFLMLVFTFLGIALGTIIS